MGGSEVVIKATGEDTDGAFFVAEIVLEAGFPGPPRHFHERLHETIYVLEGELVMTLGDEVAVLAPGAFASIPPGVIHTFRIVKVCLPLVVSSRCHARPTRLADRRRTCVSVLVPAVAPSSV